MPREVPLMYRNGHLILILLLAACLTAPRAVAATMISVPDDTAVCSLHGHSNDTDTAGLNVRAAPNATAPVVARFPYRKDKDGQFVEFEILGFKDGWALIHGGSFGRYGDNPPAVYAGWGWISASKIGGSFIGSPSGLLADPAIDAKSKPFGKDSDAVVVKKLLDCKESWAKVETDVGSGWVGGLCSNQVTTCN